MTAYEQALAVWASLTLRVARDVVDASGFLGDKPIRGLTPTRSPVACNRGAEWGRSCLCCFGMPGLVVDYAPNDPICGSGAVKVVRDTVGEGQRASLGAWRRVGLGYRKDLGLDDDLDDRVRAVFQRAVVRVYWAALYDFITKSGCLQE